MEKNKSLKDCIRGHQYQGSSAGDKTNNMVSGQACCPQIFLDLVQKNTKNTNIWYLSILEQHSTT